MQIATRHLVDIVAIVGLSFGVLGSLYLAYDLLGRPHGLLRIVTGLLTFAITGALVFGPIYLFTNPQRSDVLDVVHVFTSGILYIGLLLGAATGISGGIVVFQAGSEAYKTRLAKNIADDLASQNNETLQLESEIAEYAAELETIKPQVDEWHRELENTRSLLTRQADILKHMTVDVYRHRARHTRAKAMRHLKRAKHQYNMDLARYHKVESRQREVEEKYHQAKEHMDRNLAVVRERRQEIHALEADLTATIEKAMPRFRPIGQYFGRTTAIASACVFVLVFTLALILRAGLARAIVIAVIGGVLAWPLFALSLFMNILVRKMARTNGIAARLANANERPPLFSWSNFTMGFIYTLIVQIPIAILNNLASPVSATLAILPFVLAGGLAGGISAAVFWWSDHVSERKLGIVGVILILVGFIIQLVPPVVDLLTA